MQVLAQRYEAAEGGAHHQAWNKVVTLLDAKGNTVLRTNFAYLELQTAMHYWENERWNDAQELIEAYPGGAIARHGGHQVIFAENLNSEVAIDLQTHDGKRLQSRVLGLRYFDPANGKSVVIAEVKDSTGQIIGNNQVLFADAFTGIIRADVRYTYTKAGLEQDVILRTRPSAMPEGFGLGKTTRLQVMTEFLAPPTPAIATTIFKTAAGDLEDQTLDFGAMQMGRGKAFTLGLDKADSDETQVGKRWAVVDGRTILYEEVPVAAIAAQLQALPVKLRTAFFGKQPVHQMASTKMHLPAPKRTNAANHEMQIAKLNIPVRGLVLDYTLLLSQPNVTLKGDTTYYVSGTVNLSGTTTIEGGTLVKYTNTSLAMINFTGPLVCQTAPYRPAVFTSKDDNSVGETIPYSTGSPVKSTVNKYLLNSGSAATSYKYLRLAYAGTGLQDPHLIDIWHSQFLNCNLAIYSDPGTIELRNVLFVQCSTCVKTPDVVYGEHLTVDGCSIFANSKVSSGSIINSIFTAVPTIGPVLPLPPSSVNLPSSSGVYQTVGGGSHYLADDTHRNKGTTAINPTLLADLRNRTTAGPSVLTANFTANTPLSPQCPRDTDTPDRGYHYDPLDFCWTSLQLANATLTLADGVAVGIYGPKGTWLRNGAHFLSSGRATTLNRLVRYNTVQEGAWGTTASVMSLLNVTEMPATLPTVELQFTDVSLLADTYSKRLVLNNDSSGYSIDTLSIKDSQLRGAALSMSLYPNGDLRKMNVRLNNNLFQRVMFSLDEDTSSGQERLMVNCANNLVLAGTFAINDYTSTGGWTAKYNLFDRAAVGLESVSHDYNGYTAGTTALSEPHYKINLTPDYQSGPAANCFGVLGSYYYLSSGGLNQLVDWGDVSSTSLGLDSYTTQAGQSVDSGNVDIGYHYLSVAAPTANPVPAQTCRNTPVNITLQGTDPNLFPLFYTVISSPQHGTLSGHGQTVTYTPTTSFCGTDSFSFKVNNGFLDSAQPGVVTITVGDPSPVANCQDVMTGKNTLVTFTLTGSDSCNDTLTFTKESDPSNGTITQFNPTTGSVSYQPNSNFECMDTFTFHVNNCGASSGPQTVTINVVPGPVLTTECRPNSIILTWTLPPCLQTLAASGYIQDFQIFRCSGVNCTPSTTPLATLSDPQITRNPFRWSFVDTSVTAGQTFCYVITFRHKNDCDGVTVFESPRSNIGCNQACTVPPGGPTDVAFIVDNTGSMHDAPLTQLRNGIASVLDDVVASSGGDYRLALVTPDEDQVDVRLNFTANNRNAFTTALNSFLASGGVGQPESTDECLNTILNALAASGRVNPRSCTPRSSPLQINNFTPGFRTGVRKLVVMITDHEPGGFCDFGDSGTQAALYAAQAHDNANCIRINAIQVGNSSDATPIMLNYYQTTCGWYEQIPTDGTGIADAVVRMLYVPGYCTCP